MGGGVRARRPARGEPGRPPPPAAGGAPRPLGGAHQPPALPGGGGAGGRGRRGGVAGHRPGGGGRLPRRHAGGGDEPGGGRRHVPGQPGGAPGRAGRLPPGAGCAGGGARRGTGGAAGRPPGAGPGRPRRPARGGGGGDGWGARAGGALRGEGWRLKLRLEARRRPLEGSFRPPGDKSVSHRAALLAGAARGRSCLRGLAPGADVASTLRALEALGVRLERRPERGGETVVESPGLDAWAEPADVVDCGNSGTTIRLLAGLLAARPGLAVLTGDTSLRRRPMDRVAEPLRAMGASVDGREGGRYAPLVVRGGPLRPLAWRSPVASAQVKSAILLAALRAPGETAVWEPVPSRDHTERLYAWLGLPIRTGGSGGEEPAGGPPPVRLAGPASPPPFALEVPADP
ncbi:MAG: hypothetical protein IRZ26_04490 [Clostridia bacterium]|nr:hypothetical protein [Clostridia bacterium]